MPNKKANATKQKKGRVVVVVNRKGGVGKSMLTAFISSFLAERGKVHVLDLDNTNQDSLKYATKAELPVQMIESANLDEVFDLVWDLIEAGTDVVIDVPPGESRATDLACMLASAIIIPTRPGFNDIGGLKRIFKLVEATRRKAKRIVPVFTVCNFYRRTDEADGVVALLQELSSVSTFAGRLWERTDYSKGIEVGKAPWVLVPGKPAAKEMYALCEYLDSQIVAEGAEV